MSANKSNLNNTLTNSSMSSVSTNHPKLTKLVFTETNKDVISTQENIRSTVDIPGVKFAFSNITNKKTQDKIFNAVKKKRMIDEIMSLKQTNYNPKTRLVAKLDSKAIKRKQKEEEKFEIEFKRNLRKKSTARMIEKKNINILELNSQNLELEGNKIQSNMYDDLLYACHKIDEFDNQKRNIRISPFEWKSPKLLGDINTASIKAARKKFFVKATECEPRIQMYNNQVQDKISHLVNDIEEINMENLDLLLDKLIAEKRDQLEETTYINNYINNKLQEEVQLLYQVKQNLNEGLKRVCISKKLNLLSLMSVYNKTIFYPNDIRDEEFCYESLRKFKGTNWEQYRFKIPAKYILDQSTKCIGELPGENGMTIKIYSNMTMKLQMKNLVSHYIYTNGLMITEDPSGNIRLSFNDGRIFFYYKEQNCSEFLFTSEGYSIIRYSNNQIEKISNDNLIITKFTNDIWNITLDDGTSYTEFC